MKTAGNIVKEATKAHGIQLQISNYKKLDTCRWTPMWSCAGYVKIYKHMENKLQSRILLLKILNEQYKSLWKSLESGRKIIKNVDISYYVCIIKIMHGCLKIEVWDSCNKKVSLDQTWFLSLEWGRPSKNYTKAIQMFPNILRKCSKIFSKDNWRLLKNFKDIPRMFQPHSNRFRCSLRGQSLFQSSYQHLQ